MKICATQGMMLILLFGIAVAHDNNAQILDRKVNINVAQIPLRDALKELEKASGVSIFYSSDQLELTANVSVVSDGQSLKDVLDKLLTPYQIEYSVFEKEQTIVLKRRMDGSSPDNVKPGRVDVKSSRNLVTGTVTESSHHSILAGVNIIVKGSANGTSTDPNGNFSLQVENTAILVFTFIGYKTTEVDVSDKTVINVELEVDVASLDEVVVNAGYYTVEEKERTGNISRVGSEEISKQPVSNPLAALEGRMPGVQITQNTGVPGGAFKVQIRGQNSLRDDGNNPLYVVDGVPFTSTSLTSTAVSGSIIAEGNPLSSINPADIESIEVLKDADATSIYGSRGSNGVVLITTKRGKAGKTKFDFTMKSGFGNVNSKMDLLNTQQYVAMRKEAFKNDSRTMTNSTAPDVLVWDTTRYTDWQKKLIGGTAHTTNAMASVSGGDERTQFTLGGAYYKETTVFPGNFNFQRMSGSLNVNHTSSNGKFRATVSANYSTSINNLLSTDLTSLAMKLSPDAPALYDAFGNINSDWKNTNVQNPLFMTRKKYRSTTDNLVTNAVLSYEIMHGLIIKSNLGFTSMQVEELTTDPISAIPTQYQNGRTASSTFGNSTLKTWIMEPQINYTRKFGNGNLNMLIGTTFQNSQQSGQSLYAYGFSSDALLENILAAPSISIVGTSYHQYRYAALFSRLNYNWKERYIVNLTARRDGSSRFGNGRQFGDFGAVGAAWVFTNEDFFKNLTGAVSFGKLRGSYGITGSDAIGNYQYLNSYTPTTYPYNGNTGLGVTRLNNPDYSWETNKKFELGLEIGMLRDHIIFSASWYNNRSSNQLVGLPLPAITGQSSVQFNFPAVVQNRGLELMINTVNVKTPAFKWTTGFNITVPTTTLVKFPNLNSFPEYASTYQVGSSIFKRRTYKATGVDPATGKYTFQDANNDSNINLNDDGFFTKIVGQKYYGGLNNSFTYNGFQLDIFFQFVKQTGENYMKTFTTPGTFVNQPTAVLERWQKPGDVTDIQKYSVSTSQTYVRKIFSDDVISDASFIRLKNVSLSWQLPEKWYQKIKMTNAKISLQGQNLFTITNYRGLDPENRNTFFLPPLRVISLGCQLTF